MNRLEGRLSLTLHTWNRGEELPDLRFTIQCDEGSRRWMDLDRSRGEIGADVSELDGINFLFVRAYHIADDPGTGVVQGDPADFEFQVNGTGAFHPQKGFLLWTGSLSAIRFRTSSETRVRLEYLICARGETV